MDLAKMIMATLETPEMQKEIKEILEEELKNQIRSIIKSMFYYGSDIENQLKKELSTNIAASAFLPKMGNVLSQIIEDCGNSAFKELVMKTMKQRFGVIGESSTPSTMKSFVVDALKSLGCYDSAIVVKIDNKSKFFTDITIDCSNELFIFKFANNKLVQFPLDFSVYRKYHKNAVTCLKSFEESCYKLYVGGIEIENDLVKQTIAAEYEPENYPDEYNNDYDIFDAFVTENFQ